MRPGQGGPEGWRHRAPPREAGGCPSGHSQSPVISPGGRAARGDTWEGFQVCEEREGGPRRAAVQGARARGAWGQRWGPALSLWPRARSALHLLQAPRPLAEPGPGASP